MGNNRKDNNKPHFLSEDDEELWNRITSTAKPLKNKDRNRVEDVEITVSPKVEPKTQKKKTTTPKNPPKTNATSPKTPPPLADIDRKKVRKISTDQISIQATLDLHGYRQEQAHTALKGFLRRSQAQEHRYVLVITGKGAPKNSGDSWDEREPGVLKRVVPQWLSDPELREIVVGYTQAHAKHGGDGALYVQLRKLKKR